MADSKRKKKEKEKMVVLGKKNCVNWIIYLKKFILICIHWYLVIKIILKGYKQPFIIIIITFSNVSNKKKRAKMVKMVGKQK